MARLAAALVLVYRRLVAPLVPPTPGGRCKYHPSCSQYALDALRGYGFVRGSLLAAWRLARCHPWSAGGVDRVEDNRLFRGARRAGA